MYVESVLCVRLLSSFQKYMYTYTLRTCIILCSNHSHGDVCLYFAGSANGMEQHLKEEQQKRSEAEKEVQLLKQRLSGELATLVM